MGDGDRGRREEAKGEGRRGRAAAAAPAGVWKSRSTAIRWGKEGTAQSKPGEWSVPQVRAAAADCVSVGRAGEK